MYGTVSRVAVLIAIGTACLQGLAMGGEARRDVKFTADWKFHKGPAPGAEAEAYDDSKWAPVRLPHDWALAGPFDARQLGEWPRQHRVGRVAWFTAAFRHLLLRSN